MNSFEITANKIRVIGDVHGHFDAFEEVVREGLSQDRFIVSLGDLEDRGPNPGQCVNLMADLVSQGRGVMIQSNHFWKHYRHLQGNSVQLRQEHERTQVSLRDEDAVKHYLEGGVFHDIPWFATKGAFFFSHAAYHPMADDGEELTNRQLKTLFARLIYGGTNGETNEEGFPVRKLDWFDRVPDDRIVVIGHHVLSKESVLKFKTNGGVIFFLDLGSGKDDGQLAYMDIDDQTIVRTSHPVKSGGNPEDYGAYHEE